MTDFSRLSSNWARWAPASGLRDVSVSTECDDCEILFESRDYSVHLRYDGDWWVVDTVNDRGERSDGDAKLSTFPLTEKYLIWDWITAARPRLASGSLGAQLYKQGYADGVQVANLDGAHIELRRNDDRAILISGTATIFSHIMLMSVDELELAATASGR
jgi:hypothetical protein